MNTEKKLKSIQQKSIDFAEKMEQEIYELCEILDYKNSSRFSYNIDRLRLFVQELKDFKIISEKSSQCSEVLGLMDKDFSYCEALKIVLKNNPTTDKIKLENELNIYI